MSTRPGCELRTRTARCCERPFSLNVGVKLARQLLRRVLNRRRLEILPRLVGHRLPAGVRDLIEAALGRGDRCKLFPTNADDPFVIFGNRPV
jgi:hypothetical protein